MHIAEGIITGIPAVAYTGAGLALAGWGAVRMKKFAAAAPENKPLLGMAAAIIFFISLIPIPSFTGTCTHPCGTPLIAILLGPAVAIGLTALSLLLQAAFFAHGGFGTWGANVVALGFFGSIFGWGVFRLGRRLGLSVLWAAAAGGLIGDLMVYGASGLILGHTLSLAPGAQYSFAGYLAAIYAAYAPTQIPIALGEMVMTGMALSYAYKRRPEVLLQLGVVGASPRRKANAATLMICCALGMMLLLSQANVAMGGTSSEPKQTASAPSAPVEKPGPMSGMDEAVNEDMAKRAGVQPRDPYIDVESMGDLWNALLLLAGGVCGFVLGKWGHLLWGSPDEPGNAGTCGAGEQA